MQSDAASIPPWSPAHSAGSRSSDVSRPLDSAFGGDGIGFDDVLQVVNPLQHIPIVGSIYRALTGDTLTPGARMAGGALYGGPLGLVAAIGANIFEEASGGTVESTVLALFDGDAPPVPAAPAPVAVAGLAADEAEPPPAPPVPPAAHQAATPAVAVAAAAPVPARPAIALTAAPAGEPVTGLSGGNPGAVPQLSPAAFDALIKALGGAAAPGASEPPGGAGAGDGSREAARDLHRQLRALAVERGLPGAR